MNYRRRCSELEGRMAKLESENRALREENARLGDELLSLKTTVSAMVARSIDAKAGSGRRRFKRSGAGDGSTAPLPWA